jgi:hypothetical protein
VSGSGAVARMWLDLPDGHYAQRLTIELHGTAQWGFTMKGLQP